MGFQRLVVSVIAVSAVLIPGCGGESAAPAIPTPEDLASVLVVPEDFEGEWSVSPGPDDGAISPSGAVTNSGQQRMLPSASLCPKATKESRAAADGLLWKAFRQLDLTVDDPIRPPQDRTGHLIFMQEFLTSADAAEIEQTFMLLRDGFKACLGEVPADEEGAGQMTKMATPQVGDDRFGVMTTVDEAGGWAQWRISNTYVEDGPVLVSIVVADITAGVEPRFSADEIAGFTMTAVEKLATLG